MQIRVKNLNKGPRGVYVSGDLVFVGGGDTSTFTGATAEERDAAAKMEGLKVQSRLSEGADWADHFKEEMPEEKPWLALATDDAGSNFKPLTDQTWYVGMAVAGERPDGPMGYKWVKVGSVDGGMSDSVETVVPVEPVKPAPVVVDKPAKDDEPVNYAAIVDDTAPNVIAKITPDNAAAIGDAEEKREGGPRKGVMKAVEEAIAG